MEVVEKRRCKAVEDVSPVTEAGDEKEDRPAPAPVSEVETRTIGEDETILIARLA